MTEGEVETEECSSVCGLQVYAIILNFQVDVCCDHTKTQSVSRTGSLQMEKLAVGHIFYPDALMLRGYTAIWNISLLTSRGRI